MRKSTPVALILMALALVSVTAGCEYGGSTAHTMTLAPTPDDPGAMVEAILDASETVTRFSCSYDVQAQFDLDPATMLPGDEMFLGLFSGPVTLSGTLSSDDEAAATELDLTFGLAGITYNMGLRSLDDQAWLSMLGQWYDLSPALEQYGGADESYGELDPEALRSAMADLGVDPVDWLGAITLAGEETLDGVPVFHLTCEPDIGLLFDDLLALLDDPDFMLALDPSGELVGALTDDLFTDADLEDMRTELPQMLDELSLDLWAGKADSLLRKLDLSLSFTLPPDEPSEGLEGIALTVHLDFYGFDQPVKVEAPENALPFSAFMEMFGSDFPLPLDDILDEPTRS